MTDGQVVVTRLVSKWRRLGLLAVDVFAHTGDSGVWIGGLAAAMIFGAHRQRVVPLFLAVVLASSLAWIVKRLVRRPRPPGSWGAVVRRFDPFSFPSGHAARAAAVAGVVAVSAPLSWGVAVLGWAVGVSAIRVPLGMHRPVDVVAGWLIGAAVAALAIAIV